MKFSRSNFKMQRFESRSPRLESWRISIPECGGSNPAAPTGQSVSNASHMKVARNRAVLRHFADMTRSPCAMAGLRVRKLATEAPLRLPVSEGGFWCLVFRSVHTAFG